FSVEFKSGYSPISLLFDETIILARVYEANRDLDIRQRRTPSAKNFARDTIATLQKAYHETGPHAASVNAPAIRPASSMAGQILVPLKREGGTFIVPVLVNKTITLNFVVDSGAAVVSIPSDVVLTLVRSGTLQRTDFIGRETYTLADGSKMPSATF